MPGWGEGEELGRLGDRGGAAGLHRGARMHSPRETQMTMKTSDAGLGLIEEFEGCILHAYPDPATGAAPWTIGYGHTHGVEPGMTCTRRQALDWLREDLQWAEA